MPLSSASRCKEGPRVIAEALTGIIYNCFIVIFCQILSAVILSYAPGTQAPSPFT